MSTKRLVRRTLETLLQAKIYRTLPRGIDQFADIKHFFPVFDPSIVFDVGANTGQSTREYLLHFPNARIFCFEPSKSAYDKLAKRFSNSPRVQCLNMAVSDKSGAGLLERAEDSRMGRLVDDPQSESYSGDTERVSVGTVDEICAINDIRKIDYLKIDTEGHELPVLAGSMQVLDADKIGMIELELGMNPENTWHTPFEDGKRYLEKYGFRLLTITEQTHEWPKDQPHLRRVNAVFVARAMIDS